MATREADSGRQDFLVWIGLLVLLGSTVLVSLFPLGTGNIVIALAIATAKALLVAFFYMRLRRSPSFIALAAAAGLFWLAILFSLALTDFLTRAPSGL